jgi:DNA primase
MIISELDFDKIKTLSIVGLYEHETGFAVKHNHGNVCPLCGSGTHDNHTGAFSLYPSKQSFYCYACQRGGSVLDFVAALRGCDTKAAAEYLNREYYHGQAMRQRNTTTNQVTTNTAAASFINKQLKEQPTSNDKGTAAVGCKVDNEVNKTIFEIVTAAGNDTKLLQYLDTRGITADIRARWCIVTFNASSYAQINKELRERFAIGKLQAAGVLSQKNNFLFYNHRILFFNRNNRGDFLNIKARAVPGTETEKKAKYLNQHGEKYPFCTSAIYTAAPGDNVAIVEGEIDAISMNELGGAAVAVGGVGDNPTIYKELLKLIARRGLIAVPCFDNDEGGQRAEAKFKTIAATVPGLQTRAGRIPNADGCKDFGDVLQRENVTNKDNMDKLEKYLTRPTTWRVKEISQNENITELETRRAFMDMIKYFGVQNITFSDNYELIKITI